MHTNCLTNCHNQMSTLHLHSTFLPPFKPPSNPTRHHPKPPTLLPITSSSTPKSYKLPRHPHLDNHITKHNKLRFIRKLKTLLLSKPKHYLPLPILSKCRSYLSLPRPRSLLSMLHRYPTLFRLFPLPSPSPHSPYLDQLCVGLTPAALQLALQESQYTTLISETLASKLQRLLMMSSYKRILLAKLVHLADDLGLPPNFRSRLCNDYPDRFKTVETSYGRALELVSWDPALAVPMKGFNQTQTRTDLIVDRPLKFKYLKLPKGVNLKRRHREFLIRFGETAEVNPYCEKRELLPAPETLEAERRACAVVREILGMTVEKRTLVDHLTHFRKEFGLSNKVRGMLVRHPEMFYVSLKGQRDSVFLVEGYDEKGRLVEKDELLFAKERLMELVREGKRMRRAIRENGGVSASEDEEDDEEIDEEYEDEDDGFENLFDEDDWEDYGVEDNGNVVASGDATAGEFWTVDTPLSPVNDTGDSVSLEHW